MRRHLLPLAILGLLRWCWPTAPPRLCAATWPPSPWPAKPEAPHPISKRRSSGSATALAVRNAGEARLARLAAREALSREAGSTYLDSLILSTDSVVRRWPDRWGAPIRVAIVEGGAPDWDPRMSGYVRTALERWESLGIGVRFSLVQDTSQRRHPGAVDRSLRLRPRGPDRSDLGSVRPRPARAGLARAPHQHRRGAAG